MHTVNSKTSELLADQLKYLESIGARLKKCEGIDWWKGLVAGNPAMTNADLLKLAVDGFASGSAKREWFFDVLMGNYDKLDQEIRDHLIGMLEPGQARYFDKVKRCCGRDKAIIDRVRLCRAEDPSSLKTIIRSVK